MMAIIIIALLCVTIYLLFAQQFSLFPFAG